MAEETLGFTEEQRALFDDGETVAGLRLGMEEGECPACAFMNAQYAALEVQSQNSRMLFDDDEMHFLHPWFENVALLFEEYPAAGLDASYIMGKTADELIDKYGVGDLPNRVLDPYDFERLVLCMGQLRHFGVSWTGSEHQAHNAEEQD